MSINPERTKAIRILGRPEGSDAPSLREKLNAVEILKSCGADDELAVRNLILALDDREISGAVSGALSDLLRKASTSSGREIIMRHLTACIFDRSFATDFEGEKFLKEIINISIEHLPETDNLVTWLMLDAGKGRKIEFVNERLSGVLVEFFNKPLLPGTQRSGRAFKETGYQMVLRSLTEVSESSPGFILKNLEQLGENPLGEVTFEIIAAIATLPFKKTYDNEINQRIIDRAVRNLLKWTSELDQDPDTFLHDIAAILRWRRDVPNAFPLPEETTRRLAMNLLLVRPVSFALIDRSLFEPQQQEGKQNLANKENLFQILSKLHFAKSEIGRICDYTNQVLLDEYKIHLFPVGAAVKFFESHLVGLNRFLNLTWEERERIIGPLASTQAPVIPKIPIGNLDYGVKITNTLKRIIENSNCPMDSRKQALKAIVKALPADLLSQIDSLNPILTGSPELRKTLYEQLGEIRFEEALPMLYHIWHHDLKRERVAGNESTLIRTLGKIGTREILGQYRAENGSIVPDMLLAAAFDNSHPELKLVRNTLVEAGYREEIEREQKRRDIIQFTSEAEQTAQKIMDKEEMSHLLILDILGRQGDFAEQLFRMSSHINNLEMVCLQKGMEHLELSIKTAEIREALIILQGHARNLDHEIQKAFQRVSRNFEESQSFKKSFDDLNAKISSKENQVKQERKKIVDLEQEYTKYQERMKEAGVEIGHARAEIEHASTEIKNKELSLQKGKERKSRLEIDISSIPNLDSQAAESKHERLIKELDSLKKELEKSKELIKDQEENLKQQNRIIKKSQMEIEDLEVRCKIIRKSIRDSIGLADEIRKELNGFKERTEYLRNEIEKLNKTRVKMEEEIRFKNLDLDQVRAQLSDLQKQLNRLQGAIKETNSQFERESDVENQAIARHRNNAEIQQQTITRQKDQVVSTEKDIENLKTLQQNQIQVINDGRRDYEVLGEECFEETARHHESHKQENLEKKVERIDRDLRNHLLYKSIQESNDSPGEDDPSFDKLHPKAFEILNKA